MATLGFSCARYALTHCHVPYCMSRDVFNRTAFPIRKQQRVFAAFVAAGCFLFVLNVTVYQIDAYQVSSDVLVLPQSFVSSSLGG